jgi:hypothetical protein
MAHISPSMYETTYCRAFSRSAIPKPSSFARSLNSVSVRDSPVHERLRPFEAAAETPPPAAAIPHAIVQRLGYWDANSVTAFCHPNCAPDVPRPVVAARPRQTHTKAWTPFSREPIIVPEIRRTDLRTT